MTAQLRQIIFVGDYRHVQTRAPPPPQVQVTAAPDAFVYVQVLSAAVQVDPAVCAPPVQAGTQAVASSQVV